MADEVGTDQGLGYIKPLTGPRAGQKIWKQRTGAVAKQKSGPSGELETPMDAADRMSSDDASHSSTESSTAGRQAQSTDHMNSY